ncbi:MAG TPA: DUF4214 domain-containing protein [Acidimicrobiales bacterium]|nr:DUF4214 domain-containing protein [Acidimicrobiales bacterium]
MSARDKSDAVVKDYTGSVQITLSDGNATPPAPKALVAGEGTFTATVKTLGITTVTATDTKVPTITGSTSVKAVLASLVVQASPPVGAVVAGSPFAFTVTATDPSGNAVLSSYAGTVTFASSDGSAKLPTSSGLTDGQGAFLATLVTAGQQTVTATDTVNASITGNSSLRVETSAGATRLWVSAPTTVTPGWAFAVTVSARTGTGSVATGFNGMVSFGSSDPSATVSPSSLLLTNGQGTVTAVLRTGGYQVITASDPVLALSGTATIAVGPPWAATHFSVGAPGVVTAGVPFSLTVTALDQYGNVAVGYGGVVRFTASGWPAALPPSSMLYGGSGTFAVTLWSTGTESVTAVDTVNSGVQGTSNAIIVVSPALPSPSQLPASKQFVSQLYQDLLGRQPDPGGLALWSAALDAGVTRSAVAASVLASPEYRLRQVNGAYSDCLSRGPDAAGESLYVSLLGRGWAPEALEAALVGSDEYFVTHGGNIPEWVAATYQDLLGRSPEPAGLAFWAYQAGAGVPRTQIAAAIESSGEYRALFVTTLYESLLGRSPAAWEVGLWSQALANGATDNQVIAAIVGSPEYLAHAM